MAHLSHEDDERQIPRHPSTRGDHAPRKLSSGTPPFRLSNADTRFYAKVVGQFTVQDPEGAKYSMEFTDDKYETKDCSLSVSELLNFFDCAAFPFKEQIGWIGAAGRFLLAYSHGPSRLTRFMLSLSCGRPSRESGINLEAHEPKLCSRATILRVCQRDSRLFSFDNRLQIAEIFTV